MMTNEPPRTWNLQGEADSAVQIVLVVAMVIILTFSLVGNLLALIIIGRTRALRRMNNMLLVSLAAADLAKAVLCMPMFVVTLGYGGWVLPSELCPVYHATYMSLQLTSISNLTAVSIDRVYMICRPLHYQRVVTANKLGIVIATLWIVSFIYGYLQILWFDFHEIEETMICHYNPNVGYAIFDFIFAYAVHVVVMVCAYARIFCIVQSHIKRLEPRISQLRSDMRSDISSDPFSRNVSLVPETARFSHSNSVDSAFHSNLSLQGPLYSEEQRGHQTHSLSVIKAGSITNTHLLPVLVEDEVQNGGGGNCSIFTEHGSPVKSHVKCEHGKLEQGNRDVHSKNTVSDQNRTANIVSPGSVSSKVESGDTQTSELVLSTSRLCLADQAVEHNVGCWSTQEGSDTTPRHNKDISDNGAGGVKEAPVILQGGSGVGIITGQGNQEVPAGETVQRDCKEPRRSSLKPIVYDSNKSSSVKFSGFADPSEREESPQDVLTPLPGDVIHGKQHQIPTIRVEGDVTVQDEKRVGDHEIPSSPGRKHLWTLRTPQGCGARAAAGTCGTSSTGSRRSSALDLSPEAPSSRRGSSLSHTYSSRTSTARRLRENKALKMFALVIGTLILCWTPYEVCFLVGYFCHCITTLTWSICHTCVFLSSAVNPFIYNFYSKEFRTALKRLCLCQSAQNVSPF